MEKRVLLAQLEQALRDGVITAADLKKFAGKPVHIKSERGGRKALSVSDVLYSIGALIVVIGIAIIVFDNWSAIGSMTRILLTLGAGIASYVIAIVILRYRSTGNLPRAFILLSVLLLPIGLYVTFHEAGFDAGSNYVHSIVSFILLATFFASYYLYRDSLFLVFAIIFTTWFYFAFLSLLIADSPVFERWKFHAYQVLVMGISYLSLGRWFESVKPGFAGSMYAVGITAFLGAALALGDYFPHQSIFWEVTYPAYAFGAIFLSVYLRRRSLLIMGSLFLTIYILKITNEYFANALSWGTAVVFVGLVLIGIGYFTYDVNKRYLTTRK